MAVAGPPPLAATFSPDGLASLRCGDADVLASGAVELADVHFAADPPAHAFDAVRRFDRDRRTAEQTYPWGTVRTTYTASADRLTLDVDVRNTGAAAIDRLSIAPMKLRFPAHPAGDDWANRYPIWHDSGDDIPVLTADWGRAELAVCDDAVDPAVSFGLQPDGASDRYQLRVSFDGGVGPGQSRRATLSLRAAVDGDAKVHVADDVARRFASLYPPTLHWPDRRPIATAFLCHPAAGWPQNPRGWFDDATLDTTTDAGLNTFRAKLTAYADAVVANAKLLDAQGVIVWDLEGQQMPHATSYVGDPRALPRAAPEMDAAADAFFAKLAAAGLRVGLTLRPTRYTPGTAGQPAWSQVGVADPVAELADKVAYARRRWGCTLFYVDSDVVERHRPDGQTDYPPMPADAFRRLAGQFPDVLLMPEQARDRFWADTAPYRELRHGFSATPTQVRSAYPSAFTVLHVNDGPSLNDPATAAALTAAVRGGDVLLFRAWWADPDNAALRRIRAAAKR